VIKTPSHKTHKLLEKLVLNEEFGDLDWFIDKPYRYYGFQHRKVRHDKNTSILLGALFGSKALVASELHQLADFSYSALKRARRKKK
jgi:uncharacterized metal-binding protein